VEPTAAGVVARSQHPAAAAHPETLGGQSGFEEVLQDDRVRSVRPGPSPSRKEPAIAAIQ